MFLIHGWTRELANLEFGNYFNCRINQSFVLGHILGIHWAYIGHILSSYLACFRNILKHAKSAFMGAFLEEYLVIEHEILYFWN